MRTSGAATLAYLASLDQRVNVNIRNEAMAVIRERIPYMRRPQGWDWSLWESSGAVYERRRKITLKIDAGGRVFIDKRMPSGDVRSKQLYFATVTEACDYVQLFIDRNYLSN